MIIESNCECLFGCFVCPVLTYPSVCLAPARIHGQSLRV